MQKAHSPEDNRTVKRLFSATLVAFGILASLPAHGQQGPTKWGLTVVNINNGFGAGYAASLINQLGTVGA